MSAFLVWDREQEALASTSVFPAKDSAESALTRLISNFPSVDSNANGRFIVVEVPE